MDRPHVALSPRPKARIPLRRGIIVPAFLVAFHLAASTAALRAGSPADDAFFSAHVQPLLNANCVRCHGGAKTKNGLDLRSVESALRGGEHGPAVVPGDPQSSLLYRYVQPGAEPDMPPGKDQLQEEEIATLRLWIERLAATSNANATPQENAAPAGDRPGKVWTPPDGLRAELVIDLLIERGWRKRGVCPAGRSDDATFVRRLYLDLLGRIPTIEERDAFLAETRSDKRERLVDSLLARPAHARHLAEVFDVILMGRTPPEGRRRGRRRDAGDVAALRATWLEYLQSAFAQNRPWDRIVRELIVARPEEASRRGAVWFLIARRDDHQRIAEAVARSVFGVQVQCAQCHDHPLAPEIRQDHYWGLVSFFKRSQNVLTAAGPRVAESATGGLVKFATLKGEEREARLTFLGAGTVDDPTASDEKDAGKQKKAPRPGDYLVAPAPEGQRPDREAIPKFSRREKFYDEIVHGHPLVALSLVNRVWALLMGRGLVHPVDRIDSAHPPSHPVLLDWLARDFRRDYDIRRLIRSIVLSQVYQLDGRPPDSGRPAQAESFAWALDRPLSAAALYRSLLVATETDASDGDTRGRLRLDEIEANLRSYFPDLLPAEYNPTLKQALYLSNNPLVDALLKPRPGNLTWKLARISGTNERIRRAFVAVLGRDPSEEEAAGVARFLDATPQSDGPLEQMVWALLAGAEFQLNH